MSSGRPDFHPTMLLEGKYGNTLIPILTDVLGQLYTVMSGYYGGVPTPILLDAAGRILAHLVGNDGGTIRDITVDAAGNLIVQIQGNDAGTLRTVAVDPTGYILARMKGSDGGTLRDIAVDANGNMIAVVKGDDTGTLRTVAVDASGVMKANITTQDLNYLKVRPVYGQMQRASNALTNITSGATTTLHNLAGKGALVGGYLSCYYGTQANNFDIIIDIDGSTAFQESIAVLYDRYSLHKNQGAPVVVTRYLFYQGFYIVNFQPGLTFESTLAIKVYNYNGFTLGFTSYVYYALVP